MIDFHYFGAGNPIKVAIMLAEIGLEHRLVHYDLFKAEHLTPEYRKINPNNKLPAIVDHDPICGGEPIAIFETGAILVYLAEKSGQFMPKDFRRRWLAQQWLIWQVAGLGPMHGQAHHFVRYAPEAQEYPLKRYMQEARRLLNVAEFRLSQAEYFAEEYSIADMACYPWISMIDAIGLSIDDYPAVRAWLKRLDARPAIRELFERPEYRRNPGHTQSRMVLPPELWSALYGEKQFEASLPR